jgi:hypothetical protein
VTANSSVQKQRFERAPPGTVEREIFDKHMKGYNYTVPEEEDIVTRLIADPYAAFFGSTREVANAEKGRCLLSKVWKGASFYVSFTLQKNSPYTKFINYQGKTCNSTAKKNQRFKI